MLISLSLSNEPTNPLKKHGSEELVGRGGVQWMDQVGEHKSHQHQDVCDPLVNRCTCGQEIADVNHGKIRKEDEENKITAKCIINERTDASMDKTVQRGVILHSTHLHMAHALKIYSTVL